MTSWFYCKDHNQYHIVGEFEFCYRRIFGDDSTEAFSHHFNEVVESE